MRFYNISLQHLPQPLKSGSSKGGWEVNLTYPEGGGHHTQTEGRRTVTAGTRKFGDQAMAAELVNDAGDAGTPLFRDGKP